MYNKLLIVIAFYTFSANAMAIEGFIDVPDNHSTSQIADKMKNVIKSYKYFGRVPQSKAEKSVGIEISPFN